MNQRNSSAARQALHEIQFPLQGLAYGAKLVPGEVKSPRGAAPFSCSHRALVPLRRVPPSPRCLALHWEHRENIWAASEGLREVAENTVSSTVVRAASWSLLAMDRVQVGQGQPPDRAIWLHLGSPKSFSVLTYAPTLSP